MILALLLALALHHASAVLYPHQQALGPFSAHDYIEDVREEPRPEPKAITENFAHDADQCTTPDPFTALGGGVCVNGGWRLPVVTPQPLVVKPVITFPADPDDDDNNEGRIVISPPCDGQPRKATWRNDYGMPIYIRQLAIWQGVSKWASVDFVSQVFVNWSDVKQKVLWSHSWDHYAPTSWHAPFERTFADPFVLPSKGWLTFVVQCSAVEGWVSELQGAQLHVLFVTRKPQ